MTPEQINRLLAEKVMGWRYSDRFNCWCERPDNDEPIGVVPNNDWNPYTDIRQAFEVVEKLKELNFALEVHSPTPIADNKKYYYAVFFDNSKDEYCCGKIGKTPSAAICKAAVEAISEFQKHFC